MANQIILFRKEEVPIQPHWLRLTNPQFENASSTPGDWQCPSGDWQWIGQGYASFNGSASNRLIQYLQNPPLAATYYDVTVSVTNLSTGAVGVFLGDDRVGVVSGSGVHHFSYRCPEIVQVSRIVFVPMDLGSGWFDGRIQSIGVSQDVSLYSGPRDYRYEPSAYLDMSDDERLGITYKVSDVKSIGKRFGAFSRSFTLPGTPGNKRALSFLHAAESSLTPRIYDPRNKTKATLICNDSQVMTGFLSLRDITVENGETRFSVELVGDDFGLINEIKGQKLSDLDLSALDHRLTLDSIRNSWSANSWSNLGFTYPIFPQFGVDVYTVRDSFRPAYQQRRLLHELIVQNGYNYSLSADLAAMSDSVFHAPIGKKPSARQDDLDNERVTFTDDADQVWNTVMMLDGQDYSVDWASNVANWTTPNVVDPGSNSENGYFIAPHTGTFSLDVAAYADLVVNSGVNAEQYAPRVDAPMFEIGIRDVDSGQVLAVCPAYYFPQTLTPSLSVSDHLFSASTTIQLNAGQKVIMYGATKAHCVYRTTSSVPAYYVRPFAGMTVKSSSSSWSIYPTPGTPVLEGMSVVAADWLKDTSCESFLSDYCKLYNAYVIPDRDNPRLLNIQSRTAFYDTSYVIDRSGRVDMSSPIVTEYMSEISSSVVNLSYRKATDEFNKYYSENVAGGKEYGSKEFAYSTDLYNDTSEIRLAVYSPTPVLRDAANRWLPAALMNASENQTKLLVRSTASTETSLPIEYYDEIARESFTFVQPYYHTTLHTDSVTDPTFDLNFGEVDLALTNVPLALTSANGFNRFYRDQLELYKSSRMFTIYMRLSNADVREHLDHLSARIWISDLNNWFQLVQITDHDPTKGERSLCKVMLLECGPSELRINAHHVYTASTATHAVNPVMGGELSSPGILGGSNSSSPTNVFNSGNPTGPGRVGGVGNTVTGSGNTVSNGTGSVFIQGNDNRVGSGLSGVTIFGSGVTATTSNSYYFGSNYTFNNSGATFFGSPSGATIGPTYATFYGPSGVTINHTGITIGPNTYITSSGITIGGQTLENTYVQPGTNIMTGGTPSRPIVSVVPSPVFSSITATTIFSGAVDLSLLLTGGTSTRVQPGTNIVTGGTASVPIISTTLNPVFSAVSATTRFTVGSVVVAASGITISGSSLQGLPVGTDGQMLYNTSGIWGARDMGIRVAANASDWFRFGDSTNTVTTSSLWSGIVGGFLNSIGGYAISSTILGGALNTVSLGPGNQSSAIISSLSSSILSATTSALLGGATNTMEEGASSVLVGGENNVIKSSSLSFVAGGNANQISASTFGFASFATIIGGSTNRNFDSNKSAIIGGENNTISGATGSAIIAASGVTATRAFTLFTNALDVQQVIDLRPLTGATPTQRDGRLFMSGSTLYCGSAGVWRAVQFV